VITARLRGRGRLYSSAPPNDRDTFLRRGGLLRAILVGVPRFSSPFLWVRIAQAHGLTHSNVTVAA
jgi:hypothetical protein